eukprot:4984420-Amphidinium_carterae.1
MRAWRTYADSAGVANHDYTMHCPSRRRQQWCHKNTSWTRESQCRHGQKYIMDPCAFSDAADIPVKSTIRSQQFSHQCITNVCKKNIRLMNCGVWFRARLGQLFDVVAAACCPAFSSTDEVYTRPWTYLHGDKGGENLRQTAMENNLFGC